MKITKLKKKLLLKDKIIEEKEFQVKEVENQNNYLLSKNKEVEDKLYKLKKKLCYLKKVLQEKM